MTKLDCPQAYKCKPTGSSHFGDHLGYCSSNKAHIRAGKILTKVNQIRYSEEIDDGSLTDKPNNRASPTLVGRALINIYESALEILGLIALS